MLLKPHVSVLLAVLLLGGMVVFPVSAYTLLNEYEGAASSGDESGQYWSFSSEGARANITHIEWEGDCMLYNEFWINDGTIEGRLDYDPVQHANISITWTTSQTEKWVWGTCTFDIDIWNYVSGATSLTPYYLTNGTKLFQSFYFNKSANTPSDPAFSFGTTGQTTGHYKLYGGSSVTAPEASFTCTPTSQFPDEAVVCTDTSTNTPTDWLWTIDAEAVGIHGWMTSTSQNFTWQSAYPGLYSVNLWANNSAGGDWENKSNYVSISENATPNNCYLPVAAGYSRTLFQCTDTSSDAAISDCSIQLHDLEGGAWSNVTDRADGVWCIDTLPEHHINAYGQATGYSNGERFNVLEWNGITYTILMIPGYVPAPATGKVWVYVYVTDMDTGLPISGAYVSLSGSGQTTKSDTTGGSGSVNIQWPNVTTAYINVAASGYTTGIKVITTSDFGPDYAYVMLHKGTQTATITPTPGPGGVTTAPTVGPYGTPGPGGTYAPGYVNNQGQQMMDLLATHGISLVYLCILATMFGLISMMGKK